MMKRINYGRFGILKNPNGSKGNHKEFSVHDDCQQMIDLLLDGDIRHRMLKRGY